MKNKKQKVKSRAVKSKWRYSNPRNKSNHKESSTGGSESVGRTLLIPNTSIGQHFFKNSAVVDAIVARSDIQSTDIVLEVGPGTGNLLWTVYAVYECMFILEYVNDGIHEILSRTFFRLSYVWRERILLFDCCIYEVNTVYITLLVTDKFKYILCQYLVRWGYLAALKKVQSKVHILLWEILLCYVRCSRERTLAIATNP